MQPSSNQTAAVAERVVRQSYGRLLAILSARFGDIALAEDALSHAFEAALHHWPQSGVPEQAEAWLLTTARHHMIDQARSTKRHAIWAQLYLDAYDDFFQHDNNGDSLAIPDQRLALMFACAHPAIDCGIRAPLILQTILGFDASTIASAFLVSPSTMAQRLVRAKTKIRDTGIRLTMPDRGMLTERLDAVLDAVYAIYTQAWSAPADGEFASTTLTQEALFLAQLLTELAPNQAEALGLFALMLYAEARRPARIDMAGNYVPLQEQECSHWNHAMIDHAEKTLRQASALKIPGRFQFEAAIQSAHAARRQSGKTNWQAIVRLYEQLYTLTASPVVLINLATALAETDGAEIALARFSIVEDDPRLQNYQAYWAALAHLQAKAGRFTDAIQAYNKAIGLCNDSTIRHFLQNRQTAMLKNIG